MIGLQDKEEDECVDFTEALVASDLSQEDPERLARALAGLKSYANSVPVSYTHLTLPTTPYV